MEPRLYNLIYEDLAPDTFKSEIRHKYCIDGKQKFIEDIMRNDLVGTLFTKKWYYKSLYKPL